MSEGFIPPHGGYHQLLSYRKGAVVGQREQRGGLCAGAGA